MPVRLSKSRIMSSLQCRKRLHLEVNRPDLATFSAATEAAFRLGHQVGEVAIELYGGPNGTLVEYSGGSFQGPLSVTRDLMQSMFRQPIFEATLQHEGVLIREDILIPLGDHDWKIVEVKASTKLKPEHVHDCAIQAWVHIGAGHALDSIVLAHVDNQFVYPGNGKHQGLLLEQDLTTEVMKLLPEVPRWVEAAREAAAGPMPDVSVGAHCATPYECPFVEYCWPSDTEFPVQGLGGSKAKQGELISAGYHDIRDVPADRLESEQQLRIRRITRQGVAELLEGAGQFEKGLAHPRYFLDFETVSPAIPIWQGTRPYQTIPFQWSCHIETATGKLDHREYLDLSGRFPVRAFSESLINCLGSEGPILVYSNYERRIIREMMVMFPELTSPLEAILERLVDLHPVTKANYYHPGMLGSWSIKAVLPTIAPDMDYQQLDGIHEGTEASEAYLEAIDPQTSKEKRSKIRQQLLDYCRHDTLAMVRLLHFLGNNQDQGERQRA